MTSPTFPLSMAHSYVTRYEMRLLTYCLMPDHFHLLVRPQADGDLSEFMRWLTLTHTQPGMLITGRLAPAICIKAGSSHFRSSRTSIS